MNSYEYLQFPTSNCLWTTSTRTLLPRKNTNPALSPPKATFLLTLFFTKLAQVSPFSRKNPFFPLSLHLPSSLPYGCLGRHTNFPTVSLLPASSSQSSLTLLSVANFLETHLQSDFTNVSVASFFHPCIQGPNKSGACLTSPLLFQMEYCSVKAQCQSHLFLLGPSLTSSLPAHRFPTELLKHLASLPVTAFYLVLALPHQTPLFVINLCVWNKPRDSP